MFPRAGPAEWLAIASLALPARLARAADGENELVRQRHAFYVAGANCPDQAEFWALVESHRQSPSPIDLRVSVEVNEGPGGGWARVSFGRESATDATRELSAATCREVAQAAALVVALALDARVEETWNQRRNAASCPRRAPCARK